ncbi:zinc finger protein 558 [Folsomia candida]|nr:zinc finger protein 558 [Folsomia candida]
MTHWHADPTESHVCHVCGKDFRILSSLKAHLRLHDESLHHGGGMFTTQIGLKKHKLTHTGIKSHKCDQCDAAFLDKRALTSHLQTHSDLRPYPCPPCEQAFKNKEYVVGHVKRIHTPGYVVPTPHKCPQCGKSFQTPFFMRAHVLQAHTEERPFTCDQCGKGFVMKSALTLHLRGRHGIDVGVRKNRLPRSKRDNFGGDEEEGR